jgi:hypothetical protein
MGNPLDVKSLFPEFYNCGTIRLKKIINLKKKYENVRNWKKLNIKSKSLSKN